ncbi:MAG: tetratricopeptide repeat protein [Nostoc sp. CreGUA01]|nr:tetratricopeptide repeat protein [Nostoc sp. CreGUA01]
MNYLNQFIIPILSTYLIVTMPYIAASQEVSNQSNYSSVNKTLTPEQIRQIAQAVTVKVLSNSKGGSGVLISKQGQTYTVLTNAHVISKKGNHRIKTPDGKIYTATVINQGDSLKSNDLAVLQFKSQENYQFAPLSNTLEVSENQEVFAAGFADDSKELVITNGKISLLSSQPLIGGYQIGYTNKIRPGMSGGALLNQSGQLIGVNGLTSNAILNEAYFYQDGTRPSAEQLQQLRKLSFAVPIQTLAKVAPNLANIPPEWRNQQQAQKPPVGNTFVDNINQIAEEITVRIDSKNNGNGSGVIIAKQDDTYYVITAGHVFKEPDNYTIITPDGQQYVVQPENIVKSEGLDAALLKFTSKQTYSVATIAKYNLYYSSTKNRWVFVSGFPGESGGKRKFTAGLLLRPEKVFSRADNPDYLNHVIDVGYGLTYSNLTQRGMSGGAVLDSMGRIIGINTGSEGKTSRQVELGLGLGVPSNSILGLATKSGLKPELLKIVNVAPPQLTEAEINLLQNHLLFTAQKPSQNATEYDWLSYANQLWRVNKYAESVAALQQAIKLKPDFYEAYFALGLTQSSQKKYAEALAAYDQAIKIKPDDYEVWAFKYSTLDDLKKYPEALAAIDKAIENNNSDVSLYVQRGAALNQLKRYPEALAALTKAIEMKPLSLYYGIRAFTRMESRDYQGALADVNQAIQLQPENAGNYRIRSTIRLLSNDVEGALADANQAIKLQPDDAQNYTTRSSVRMESQDYQGALADANQAIELQSDDANNYYYRSNIRKQFQDSQGALVDINQAIKLQPDDVNYYMARAGIRFDLKDYQASLVDCNQGIKLEPNNADGYHCRGTARALLFQDPEKALSDYDRAVELGVKFDAHKKELYYIARGETRRLLKNYQGAIADYNEAIKLLSSSNSHFLFDSSDLASAYSKRGIVRYQLKDYQGAIADYNEAIKLQPDNIQLYFTRGNIYFQLKDYKVALADFDRAIKLQPDNANAYFVRAAVYTELKNYQLALADYNQVIKLQPDNAQVYAARGIIYQIQRNDRAALSDYNQALTKDGKLALAIINIGYIKYEKGDIEGAIQQWEKAVEINSKLAEPQMALAVALYAKGEQQKALNMAQAALRLDKSWADVEVLKQNLWGTRLIDEARKLLVNPSIQAFVKQ